MKRLCAILLTITMIFTMIPYTALARESKGMGAVTSESPAEWTIKENAQNVRFINTEIRYNGSKSGDAVFKFENGTGDNAIREITELNVANRTETGSIGCYTLSSEKGDFTYDLEKGELKIPYAQLSTCVSRQYVCNVYVTYILANNQKVEPNLFEVVPESPTLIDDFVNDGKDAWYLLYDENEEDPPIDPFQATYTGPLKTVEFPTEALGKYIYGTKQDFVGEILDEQGKTIGTFQGKRDSSKDVLELTMPYDVDLKVGTYPLRFTLHDYDTDEPVTVENRAELVVEEEVYGVHLTNTVIRYKGSRDGNAVFKFKNGVGDNAIREITGVKIANRDPESGYVSYFQLTTEKGDFTYDLEKGELYIPNSRLFNWIYKKEYVYYVCMDFTLENNEKAVCDTKEIVPEQPVLADEFVNDGKDAWYLMYSDKQSSTISGSLLSYGDENDVTIELYRTGENVPTYSTSVLATTGQANFTLTDVESGVYTMKVSKKNHVTREYAVTVEDMDMVQDVEICLLGDATGDGKVNIKDWNRLKNYLVGLDVLTDYQLKCADVTCDEKVNIKDWNRLKNHLVGLDPLW